MKILGIGSVLLSDGVLRYTVTHITKGFIALKADTGCFIQFQRDTFEKFLNDNTFTVVEV